MELIKTAGGIEITTPMFYGPITPTAARELADELRRMADLADQATANDPDPLRRAQR